MSVDVYAVYVYICQFIPGIYMFLPFRSVWQQYALHFFRMCANIDRQIFLGLVESYVINP